MVIIANKYYPVVDQPITEQLSPVPAAYTTNGSVMCTDLRGTTRYIYVLNYSSSYFYRYDTYNNVWQQLASPTGTVGLGTTMIFDPSRGTAGYVWALLGTTAVTPTFQYYDIALNTWTTCSVSGLPTPHLYNNLCHPCTLYSTDGNDDILYLIGNSSTTIYSYSISNDLGGWTASPGVNFPNLPSIAHYSCRLNYLPAWDSNKLVYFTIETYTPKLYSWDFKTGDHWDSITFSYLKPETSPIGWHLIQRGMNSPSFIQRPNGEMLLYDIILTQGAEVATTQGRCNLLGYTAVLPIRWGQYIAYIKDPSGQEFIYALVDNTTYFLRVQLW